MLKHCSITSEELARLWKRADEINPIGDASPTDYGWKLNQTALNRIGSKEVQFSYQDRKRLGVITVTVMRMMRKFNTKSEMKTYLSCGDSMWLLR